MGCANIVRTYVKGAVTRGVEKPGAGSGTLAIDKNSGFWGDSRHHYENCSLVQPESAKFGPVIGMLNSALLLVAPKGSRVKLLCLDGHQ